MIENGMRLQVECADDRLVIIETLQDKKIVYDNKVFVCDEINHTEVINYLMGVEHLLMSNKLRKALPFRPADHVIKGFHLRQKNHCDYSITLDNKCIDVLDGTTIAQFGLSPSKALNEIGKIIELLGRGGNRVLSPTSDTCRLVSSLDLFVIKTPGCKIVLDSKNKCGNVLVNCLYNNIMFNWLYIDVHPKENRVYIFNNIFSEVTSLDLDESFLEYFVDDTNTFKEEQEL